MTQHDIEEVLARAVCNIQQLSGRVPVSVSATTRPILDVPGFDSLNGVEATIDAMDDLKIDLDLANVFVQNDKALTIQQAAIRLVQHLDNLNNH